MNSTRSIDCQVAEVARKSLPRVLVYTFIAVLFLSALLTTTVLPPFQSPDEFTHIQRAYLLSKGTVLLFTPEGMSSGGGLIDTGLLAYMAPYQRYPFHPHRKVSPEIEESAKTIGWSGIREFRPNDTPNYFPIAYAPQAFGLAIGEALSLSVDTSYRLARLFALLTSLALLVLASRIFNPPLIVLGLLIIPMSLFQMSSASLDGVANSVAILGISAFARVVVDKRAGKRWVLWILYVTVFVVVSSREHLAPLLLLVFGAYFYVRRRGIILAGVLLTGAVAVWVWLAMTSATYPSISGQSASELVAFYASHPLTLLKVFANSVPADLLFWAASFVGILGWLDVPLRMIEYGVFCFLILALFAASTSFKGAAGTRGARAMLLTSSVLSIFITLFWFLIAWTAHPASAILGVQGRYFFIPVVAGAYALSLGKASGRRPGFKRLWGIPILFVLVVFSVLTTTLALHDRYYPNPKYTKTAHTATASNAQYGDLPGGRIADQAFVAKRSEGWWASRDYLYNNGVAIGSDYVRVRSTDGSVYVYPWRDLSGY